MTYREDMAETSFLAGNSISHQKYLESMADEVIPGLEMPSDTPLIHEVDADLKPILMSFRRGSRQFHPYHHKALRG